MTTQADPARHTAETEFAAVVEFLSADHRADRFLGLHLRHPDGHCQGCFPSVVEWPCPVHPLAVKAQRLADALAAIPAPRRPVDTVPVAPTRQVVRSTRPVAS